MPEDDGYRPAFLGHILVEILLDAWLIAQTPERLDDYYRSLAEVDPGSVQTGVNRIASKTTEDIVLFLPRFLNERFLYDYPEDGKLWIRLNQVMRRVGLPLLAENVQSLFPAFRSEVASRAEELLARPNVAN